MRTALALVTALLAGSALAACAPAGDAGTIALLLPEAKTSRYEAIDRPVFEAEVAALCPDCRVLYANAGQDAARQQQQAESVLSQGADVVVLGAVDAVAAQGIVVAAHDAGARVIAYDRFIANAPLDLVVSYDAAEVGRLQAEALVAAVGTDLAPDEGILVLRGAATDPNAQALYQGLTDILATADIPVLAAYDVPDWSPDKARDWVESQLTQYGDRVVGVYAANDGVASGAISAMRAAGLDPVPPVTGQDAEIAAVQRVISGDQLMTVHKGIDQQARIAARAAVRLLNGEPLSAPTEIDGVPAVLLAPVAVTRKTLPEVVVASGILPADAICTEPYRAACVELGLIKEDG